MDSPKLNKGEKEKVDALVQLYLEQQPALQVILENLEREIWSKPLLKEHVHTIRRRTKDPEHLHRKLAGKLLDAKDLGKDLSVTKENLFQKINDLAGMRILHLHAQQFAHINDGLLKLFKDHTYKLIEKPKARTWDDESRKYFKSIGINTMKSPSLYTSIHYVIQANRTARFTCEIQVRTLMEEVWGEVDHSINYPRRSDSLACREQILALARSTSACSRLVDSIFRSHEDFEALVKAGVKMPKIRQTSA